MKLYPKTWKDFAFSILRIIAGVYVVVLVLLLVSQEKLIFFPTTLPPDYKFELRHPFEEKVLEVDGNKIHSLLFKVKDSKGLILYFHGNAGSLDIWGDVAQQIVDETAMSIWIIDYPGFGKSEGRISSENQLHQIATAFMDASILMEGTVDRIVVYGRSIGSGLAVKLASDYGPAGLILESPFYSLLTMAQDRYPWAPLSILRYKFRSDLWMPRLKCPVLILHGDQDEIIPMSQAQKLAGLAKNKSFMAIHSGHHNDLSSFPEFWESLKLFLKELKLSPEI